MVRKATKKKTPPRKPKTVVRRKNASSARMQSFRVAKSNKPFFSFKPDIQTVYWAILAISILLLGVWMLTINDRLQRLYDQVDRTNLEESNITTDTQRTEYQHSN